MTPGRLSAEFCCAILIAGLRHHGGQNEHPDMLALTEWLDQVGEQARPAQILRLVTNGGRQAAYGYRPGLPNTGSCVGCGTSLAGRDARARYCSRKCRDRAYWARRRDLERGAPAG